MRKKRSKIHPIRWTSRGIRILDQTRLPEREVYVYLRSVSDVVRAIRRLMVRGAPLIGITAAYGMALSRNPRRDAKALIAARPTGVNLRWAVERMLGNPTPAAAKAIHEEDRKMCDAMGRHGAGLIGRGASALTICNTGALATGGIGTAFGVLLTARAKFFALETRPVDQGARLTMWEAGKNGLDATLISDSAAATVLRSRKISAVISGADRIASNGDTANKIGTYGLAILAREHKVPFYVAAPSSTFDFSIRSGRQIPIEERDPAEVLTRAPRGVKAYNPAFDVTPYRLISGIITEKGVLRPPYRKIKMKF